MTILGRLLDRPWMSFGPTKYRIWLEKFILIHKYVHIRSPKRPFTKRCTFRSLLRPKTMIMFTRAHALVLFESFFRCTKEDASPHAQQPTTLAPPRSDNHALETRISANMSQRFKDEKQKFSGALGECLSDFVSEIHYAVSDYSLTRQQSLRYLDNRFRGNAKRFFQAIVERRIQDFGAAIALLTA